jgi:hypothetical protein
MEERHVKRCIWRKNVIKKIIFHCVLEKCVLCGILYGRNVIGMLNGIFLEEEYHKKTKIIIYHCVLEKCVLFGILYGRNVIGMLNGVFGGRIT